MGWSNRSFLQEVAKKPIPIEPSKRLTVALRRKERRKNFILECIPIQTRGREKQFYLVMIRCIDNPRGIFRRRQSTVSELRRLLQEEEPATIAQMPRTKATNVALVFKILNPDRPKTDRTIGRKHRSIEPPIELHTKLAFLFADQIVCFCPSEKRKVIDIFFAIRAVSDLVNHHSYRTTATEQGEAIRSSSTVKYDITNKTLVRCQKLQHGTASISQILLRNCL